MDRVGDWAPASEAVELLVAAAAKGVTVDVGANAVATKAALSAAVAGAERVAAEEARSVVPAAVEGALEGMLAAARVGEWAATAKSVLAVTMGVLRVAAVATSEAAVTVVGAAAHRCS